MQDVTAEVGSRHAAAQAHAQYLDTLTSQLAGRYELEKQEACRKIEQQQAELRKQLEADHSKQIADLEAQHKAAAAEWEAMLTRRKNDSQLFKYTVRGCEGPQLSGCVPRHIFQAEPNSALAHIYDGKWSYATDEQGRAVVNSDPAHWPIIVNWLSFGTVPKDPPAGLVSECKYWQLDNLIAALSPAAPDAPLFSVRTTKVDNNSGFSASTSVANFPQRLEAAASKNQKLGLPFSAVGRKWELHISSEGVYLHLASGAVLSSSAMTIALGIGLKMYTKSTRQVQRWSMKKSLGWPFKDKDELQQLLHPALLCADGALEVSITLGFSS